MKTILAIDDDADLLQIVTLALQHAGYRVVSAINGREGLEFLGQVRPDLVLCDMVMPVLDGQGVYAAMQADESYRQIPLVLVSSAPHELMRACPNALLLSKPFEIPMLLKVVHSLIGKSA